MLSAFIDDGYSQDIYFEAIEGLYPPLRFTCRPLLREEISQHIDQMEGKGGPAYDKSVAEILADKISKWDMKDRAGKPVSISADNLRKICPAMFRRLLRCVWGDDPGDVDRAWSREKKAEHAALAANGNTPQEANEKNSSGVSA